MSNVPASKRSESKLKVLIEMRNLTVYTLQICTNEKVFDPKYKTVLTDKITTAAEGAFIDAWKANSIRVFGGDARNRYQERARLQRQALMECDSLFPLIELAMKIYHLRASRVEYWVNKTLECRTLLQAWILKDNVRYKDMI